MKEKEFSTYRLLKEGLDRKILFNLQHNKNVTILTLEKLCTILDCKIEDVAEIIVDKQKNRKESNSFTVLLL